MNPTCNRSCSLVFNGLSSSGTGSRCVIWLLLLVSLGLKAGASASDIFSLTSMSERLTAVNSKQFNGYTRTRLTDGSFQQETYAFGNGGVLTESSQIDPTFDPVDFETIAQIIADPLAGQNYVFSSDPKKTKLLIMVFWGFASGARNMIDGGGDQDSLAIFNASLMGFDAEARALEHASGAYFMGHIIREAHASELSALEGSRYYVILRAFDFQAARKDKRLNLLWETRFSLSERRHSFYGDLPKMAETAATYFGQDTNGMVKDFTVRQGTVRIGELIDVEDLSDMVDQSSRPAVSSIAGDWRGVTQGFKRLFLHIDTTGESSIENTDRNETLRCRVELNGGDVTVTSPGWDLIIRGKVNGEHITGSISEYGLTNNLELIRTAKPREQGLVEKALGQGK